MYKIRISQLTPKVSDFYIRHELYSLIQNEFVIMIYLKQSSLMRGRSSSSTQSATWQQAKNRTKSLEHLHGEEGEKVL